LFCERRGELRFQTIILERNDGVATITLNRPERRNAMNRLLLNEMGEALEHLADDNAAKVLIVTGGEQFFSAGADLTESIQTSNAEEAFRFSQRYQELFIRINSFAKPVIAAIGGFALGGGLELAMSCDYRIASEKARFGVPEIYLGAFPAGGGTQILPRLVGLTKAFELLIDGDPIDAQEAFRISLVNKVVPPDRLMAEANSVALRWCARPSLAVKAIKTLIHKGYPLDIHAAFNYESHVFAKLHGSEDMNEGLRAFLEKRKPVFKGR
jgi:enoyl-CoA hydratase